MTTLSITDLKMQDAIDSIEFARSLMHSDLTELVRLDGKLGGLKEYFLQVAKGSPNIPANTSNLDSEINLLQTVIDGLVSIETHLQVAKTALNEANVEFKQ